MAKAQTTTKGRATARANDNAQAWKDAEGFDGFKKAAAARHGDTQAQAGIRARLAVILQDACNAKSRRTARHLAACLSARVTADRLGYAAREAGTFGVFYTPSGKVTIAERTGAVDYANATVDVQAAHTAKLWSRLRSTVWRAFVLSKVDVEPLSGAELTAHNNAVKRTAETERWLVGELKRMGASPAQIDEVEDSAEAQAAKAWNDAQAAKGA